MSAITNKLNEFLKANDGKLEVSTKDLYQLFSQISLLEKGSENIKKGVTQVYEYNVSKQFDIDLNNSDGKEHLKKIISDSIENNKIILGSKSLLIDSKIEEILKVLSGLSYDYCSSIFDIAKEKLKEKSILHT